MNAPAQFQPKTAWRMSVAGRSLTPGLSQGFQLFLITSIALFAVLLRLEANESAGFDRNEGFLSATNVLRVFVMTGILGLTVASIVQRGISFLSSSVIGLTLFYCLGFLSTLANMQSPGPVVIKQILSVVEWLIVIVFCAHILNFGRKLDFREGVIVYVKFTQYLGLATIAAVFVAGLFVPDIAFFKSGSFSYGGAMIHQNKLSVLCALGAASWLNADRRIRSVWISVFLVVIAIATGSRSGGGLSLLVFCHGMFGRLSPGFRVLLLIPLAAAIAQFAIYFGWDTSLRNAILGSRVLFLNNRDDVWQATMFMIREKPWLGWGWIEGPAQIGRFTSRNWWFARNAQNDMLNFMVANGTLAALGATYLYVRGIVVGALSESDPLNRVLAASAVVFTFSSFVEPIGSTRLTTVGVCWIMFLLVCLKYRAFVFRTLPRAQAV